MSLQQWLLDEGLLEAVELAEAAAEGEREAFSLAEVLVQRHWMTGEQLADFVARKTEVPRLPPGELMVDAAVAVQVSPALARRYLVLPLAWEPEGLRVAFADPSEPGARQVLPPGPIVAFVAPADAIRDALAVVFGEPERTTARFDVFDEPAFTAGRSAGAGAVYRGPGDTVELDRRAILEAAIPGSDTSPILRLSPEATLAQKHEALLLALIEAGVISRDDYERALLRLLKA